MNYLMIPGLKREFMKKAFASEGLFEMKAESIIATVAEHFHFTIEDVKKKGRKREYVMARKMCAHLLREHTKLSLKRIGKLLGGQDHTTAIHAIHSLNDLCFSDPTIYMELATIEKKINS